MSKSWNKSMNYNYLLSLVVLRINISVSYDNFALLLIKGLVNTSMCFVPLPKNVFSALIKKSCNKF